MTGPERPVAETLRAAATVLRERDAKASSPHWWNAETCIGPSATPEDARWIATVHPGLAVPLAAWLEFEAGIADRCGDDEVYGDAHPAPVAVARVILGETS